MRFSKIEKKLRDDKYKRRDEEMQKAMSLYHIDDFDEMKININNEEIPKNNKVKSFIHKLIKRKEK